MSNVVGNLIIGILAKTDGLESGLAGAQDKLQKFGGNMTAAGAVLTAGITAPLLGVGFAAVDASTKLNSEMANVASLDIASDRVLELKGNVQDLAIDMAKNTTDISGGLYQVISTFGDTSDTVKILEINAKGAAAGLATTTDAINLTGAVTKAYGDTSAEAVQKVSDLALKTVVLGQTTFPELAGSIGAVTPLANGLNVSVEEMFGVMATATGVTGNTSEVATQLRGTLQSLMAPTDSMKELLTKLGYASGGAAIEGLGLQGTINAIVTEANTTGKPLQDYIGSIEGQTLAMQLAGASSTKLTENIQAMGNVAGATDKAFAAQTQGVNELGFKWEQTKIKIDVARQRLGDALVPTLGIVFDRLSPLIGKVEEAVTWFSNLDPQVQTNVIAFAGIAAAIGPVVIAVGAVASGISALTPLFTLLTGPIGLVVLAVGALYLAWSTNFLGIQDIAKSVWESIKTYWDGMTDWLKNVIPNSLSSLKESWDTNWTGITTFTSNAKDSIYSHFEGLKTWFTDTFPNAGTDLKSAWDTTWKLIKAVVDLEITGIKTVFGTLKTWLTETIPNAYTTLKDSTSSAWDSIKGFITNPIDTIKSYIDTLVEKITSAIPNAFDTLKNAIANISFPNPFADLLEWIQDLLDKVDIIPDWVLGGNNSNSVNQRSVVGGKGSQSISGNGFQAIGAGNINVTVNVDKVSSEVDVNALAYKIADTIKRKKL